MLLSLFLHIYHEISPCVWEEEYVVVILIALLVTLARETNCFTVFSITYQYLNYPQSVNKAHGGK